jgi:Uma2 family endonuclease
LVEFDNGRVEVLAMPTEEHQLIVRFLVDCLRGFIEPRHLGIVLFAPLRVLVASYRFREPDVVLMLSEHSGRRTNDYWLGADLVMEVVSEDPDSRTRDYETKRREYAETGIGEYWIVDPRQQRIQVLQLSKERYYVVRGDHGLGDVAHSSLLDGFAVDVAAALEAGKQRGA